jgi:hypothetical protein
MNAHDSNFYRLHRRSFLRRAAAASLEATFMRNPG